jgi:NAD(P)-dependent dehydrogenase (short-subunit alcohol dehydrogenase family)
MSSASMDLTGKVAFITGAAGGIGAATAHRLARLGATVIGADVLDDAGRGVFDGLGPPHRYVHLDVTDASAWETVIGNVVGDAGRIDIVHLNAGIMLRPRGVSMSDDPIAYITPERLRQVLAINLEGVALGMFATIDHLAVQGGDLILTASIAGLTAYPADPIYSVSKHAVVAMVSNFAPLLADRGIRINAICPGGIETDMAPPDVKARHRLSPPSFIADVLVDILENPTTGAVYVAMSDAPGGVWRHEAAPLAAPGPT